MEGFVTLDHVSKTYGSGEGQVHALKDASFTIDKGKSRSLWVSPARKDHAFEYPRRHGHADVRPRISRGQ